MTRLERREWDASRSRTESPWIASMRRLRESRWDAARLRRSPIVDRAAGAASGEAAAGEASGEPLVLGFGGEREGERKLRSAAGDGGVPPADGEEPPESREAGLGVALGFGAALDLSLGLGLGFGLGAAAALAFLMATAAGVGVGGRRNLKFELAVVEEKREGPGFIIYVKNTQAATGARH